MLRLSNVSAGYGAVTALRNVDMTVGAGEVVGRDEIGNRFHVQTL